ncbi:hypothetical protein HYALB_00000085 [Hymenoscyphus albidus]|uniref:Uncharacterized protein n=1 Tax=Hymenoscyphus albidus TaxID=595503 RepID=A0A9N9Q3F3_9HELO|nr:hypothetical protein HYALB_00000085 [Hymenoscyphus albidus]
MPFPQFPHVPNICLQPEVLISLNIVVRFGLTMNGHEAHGQGQYQYHRDPHTSIHVTYLCHGTESKSCSSPPDPQFAQASYGMGLNLGPPWIPQAPNFPHLSQHLQPSYGMGYNFGPPQMPQYPQPSYGMRYDVGPPQMPQYPQPSYGMGYNVGPPWIPQYPQPSYGMGYNFGPPQMPQYPQHGYGMGCNSSPAQFTQFTQFPQMPQYPKPSYGMAPPLNNPPVHQQVSNNGPVDRKPSNSDNVDQKPSNSDNVDQKPSNSGPVDQQPSNSDYVDQKPSSSDNVDQQPSNNRSDREDNGTKKRRQVILFHSCSSLCFVLNITPKQSMVNTYLEMATVLCRVAYHNVVAEIELAVLWTHVSLTNSRPPTTHLKF